MAIKLQERAVVAINSMFAQLERYSALALWSWGALAYMAAKIAEYF
jgi:hypothetical protein